MQPSAMAAMRQEKRMGSRHQAVGKGDECGHRMRLLKLKPDLETFSRREQKRGTF